MKAYVDAELCIGCEVCTSDQPEIFHMNDEGVAEAITDELSDDLIEEAKEAVDNCPVEAISVK